MNILNKNMILNKDINSNKPIAIGIENKKQNKKLLNNIKKNHFKNNRKFKTIKEML
jgi:hypothetical protein